MLRFILSVCVIGSLAACEGSSAFYADHPTRKSVNGVAVIQDKNNVWHSWREGFAVDLGDAVTAKQAQVSAIETISGCKVVDTAFRETPGLANFMTAQVDCA